MLRASALASTGRIRRLSRRALLKILALPPLAAWACPAGATEYATAAEVLLTVARLEAEVAERLRGLALHA